MQHTHTNTTKSIAQCQHYSLLLLLYYYYDHYQAELGIPTFVVDLRHDATHTALPSLPSLRVAVPRILGWLKAHYWERQDEQLTDAREAVAAQVQSYALKVAADAKHAKTDAILKQVTHACSPNTLHTTLLPALLKQGALVPSVSPPTITTQVQKRQIKLWGRYETLTMTHHYDSSL